MLLERTFRALLAFVCGLALCGCNPPGQSASDEETEPQFLIGRSRVNAMNFAGAIEAFEQALEKNPQSGAAHFELGWLYAEKEADAAAAIYHYQKYLKLRPSAANGETIKEHIFRLKQELAKGVLPVPPSNEMQKQLEQLVDDNRKLNEEVLRLKSSEALHVSQPNRPNVNMPSSRTSLPSQQPQQARPSFSAPPPGTSRPLSSVNANPRQHRVQAGDTPSSIARRYNVKLESLLTANPSLNPRRLQVGQNLAIPGR
ncbi:MAG: LysM peptidoglycan-binding domain-containing protein [Verrucomicrobia bacterium]|jgi:LysM repeat protein|nr:MAG: LysM peptidoglycan-binding domain-containing protein [Verrucomicrobiota bacterium]